MFSVIIPVSNSENSIIDSINSALNQEENYEILIGLNNISDTTKDKLKYISKKDSIRIFDYEDIFSISQVLNNLIAESKYDHIVRHDSDDFMYSNRLTVLKNIFFNSNPPDIVGTKYTINFYRRNLYFDMNKHLIDKPTSSSINSENQNLLIKSLCY